MNSTTITQELLLSEALTSRVEASATKIVTEGQKEIVNPIPHIIAAAAKALTKISDNQVANNITNSLVDSAAAVSVNVAIANQISIRNNELEDELSEVNEKYATLLEQMTAPEEACAATEPMFLPAPEDTSELEELAEPVEVAE